MAEDELDLIVHLGDYIYEYGIDVSESPREKSLPQEYKKETTDLDTYRIRYGLSQLDRLESRLVLLDLVISSDDIVRNIFYLERIPAFIQRIVGGIESVLRASDRSGWSKSATTPKRFDRYYEFVTCSISTSSIRGSIGPTRPVMTCSLRSTSGVRGGPSGPQAVRSRRVFRVSFGAETTWNVAGEPASLARWTSSRGLKMFRTEQWVGYVPEQNLVKTAFEEDANNPVVITGAFHSHWAIAYRARTAPVTSWRGVRRVTNSSGGNGTGMVDFGRSSSPRTST